LNFKKKDKQLTFAEMEAVVNNTFTNNRLKRLQEIDDVIDWAQSKQSLIQTTMSAKIKLAHQLIRL
jgi:hypothetical protein